MPRLHSPFLPLILIASILGMVLPAQGKEIGFVEEFALAQDRAKALEHFIPGTETYFYYNCLHLQNLGEFDKVDQYLNQWAFMHGRNSKTKLVDQIRNRQALFKYGHDPKASLEYIRNTFGIHHNYSQPKHDRKPDLPTSLDPGKISRETLYRREKSDEHINDFEDRAMDWLVNEDLNEHKLRNALQRMTRPDHPRMVELILKDLGRSTNFGSLPIHNKLLLTQLDELKKRKPSLLSNSQFVHTYLFRLVPAPDEDWQKDPAVKRAYLQRTWDFAGELPPVFNSLKANILYRWLEFDRTQGEYNRERFMQYIKLPRRVPYILPQYIQTIPGNQIADLGADFSQHTRLLPIVTDEPLVRDYLAHFFRDAELRTALEPFEPYFREEYLKHVFAETKILAGIGNMETWYAMLPAAANQQLKDRVDILFDHTNPQYYDADDTVTLTIHIKNVETLHVKVYEINNLNYYHHTGREVNTDINLDGLVANEEKTYTYEISPHRQVKREFTFESLDHRGVYVIEFIGNGISSRALVHKGSLRLIAQPTAAGMMYAAFNEKNEHEKNARLHHGSQEFKPDARGRIFVPYTTRGEQSTQQAMVVTDEFASLVHIEHPVENYELDASFHVDREDLIARNTARVIIRARLLANGMPAPLTLLENVQLRIVSKDMEEVESTFTKTNLELAADKEAVVEFHVPANLQHLQFTLSGTVKSLTRDEPTQLSAVELFDINGINKTDKIESAHLMRHGKKYLIFVLGKTGEPRQEREVELQIKHRDFRQPVHVTLMSDEVGVIDLGELPEIERVHAKLDKESNYTWTINSAHRDHVRYADVVHVPASIPVRLPYMLSEAKRENVSLLELRNHEFAADQFAAIEVRNGFLVIDGLPQGDYSLYLKDSNQEITLRIVEGPVQFGYILGEQRHMQLINPQPLQITAIVPDENKITIQLDQFSDQTRVHVLATRFQPAFHPFDTLKNRHTIQPRFQPIDDMRTLMIAGRNIGDEYRYILDRRYAEKYPGNMLPRPEYLLNPWAVRDTQTDQKEAADGEAPAAIRQPERRPGEGGAPTFDLESHFALTSFTDVDFLKNAAAILTNLKPDENGRITIDRADLLDKHHLHIVAIDVEDTVVREYLLPAEKHEFRDLRLRVAFDAEKHYTEQKQITILEKGKTLELNDLATSEIEIYDSLSSVYQLYATLRGGEHLRDFRFILDWPNLDDKTKREKYSEFACHELNFFLYRKDRAFFDAVIRPYLANKKDKTFMDHYLLDADLTEYLQLWHYSRLNVAERALLARRVNEQHESIARAIRDEFHLLPPNTERDNRLFEAAIRGNALAPGGMGATLNVLKDSDIRGGGSHFSVPRPQVESAGADRVWRSRTRNGAGSESMNDNHVAPDEKSARELQFLTEKPARKTIPPSAGFAVEFERLSQRQLYRQLDKTKEWAENNYYKLLISKQDASLITVNSFWDAFVHHPADQPFHTEHIAYASGNFTEQMLALALLDVPFESAEHDQDIDEMKLSLTTASQAIVFHKEILPAEFDEEGSKVLVSQNFYQLHDRYRYENNQKLDKFVTDEFLVHTVYGCQVVITNPTSAQMKLDVLLQIPPGAMPVLKSRRTRSQSLYLKPYHTVTLEYHFYFPQPGNAPHYPVQVAHNEKVIATVEPVTLKVVEKLSHVDKESWIYIASFGSSEDVIEFLQTRRIPQDSMHHAAWRLGDEAFYKTVVEILENRYVYSDLVWSFAFQHRDEARIREYLRRKDDFLAECGPYIDTELITIDPIERRWYEHLEYSPLVNARTHTLGKQRHILNDRFHEQYHRLLDILAHKPLLDSVDHLSIAYYMFLQDRVSEGIAHFKQVDAAELPSRLQYDYFTAYVNMYENKLAEARQVAQAYNDHPVDRWRERFREVIAQVDQIEGRSQEETALSDKADRDQKQAQLAATDPMVNLLIQGRQIQLQHRNLRTATVNYYLMDVELLFSRQPFVAGDARQFSYIKPNMTQEIELPQDGKPVAFDLPQSLQGQNVLVEVKAAGITRTQTYYSNDMNVQFAENYGHVTVTQRDSGKPMPQVYVKVYVRMDNGEVKFFKDGYTDLRGRFDYASLSTNDLDHVKRLSVLVLSEEHGAVVEEVDPPQR